MERHYQVPPASSASWGSGGRGGGGGGDSRMHQGPPAQGYLGHEGRTAAPAPSSSGSSHGNDVHHNTAPASGHAHQQHAQPIPLFSYSVPDNVSSNVSMAGGTHIGAQHYYHHRQHHDQPPQHTTTTSVAGSAVPGYSYPTPDLANTLPGQPTASHAPSAHSHLRAQGITHTLHGTLAGPTTPTVPTYSSSSSRNSLTMAQQVPPLAPDHGLENTTSLLRQQVRTVVGW